MSRKTFQRSLLPILISILSALPALADSHVRIVRLSLVEGNVKVDRGTGQFEKAIVNLPITQGIKVRTSDDGRAEVEFEDGSTLRLTPETTVEFPQLSLRDSGTKVSTAEVSRGTAYVDFTGTKSNELALEFGQEKIVFTQASHARIGVDERGATLAVFKGELSVEGPSGAADVKKNQSADFDFSNNDRFTLAKKIQQEPEDNWDKQQDQYHQQYASKSYNSYSPYAYGTNDLAYYGNFFNAPGYGMLWQPYFVGAGWDPFMDGAWAFYPGFGFGWVSAYPWGWTPYHYGTWLFLPGYGWAWQPGGVWMPMYTQVVVLNAPAGFVSPRAPATGTGTVVVNRGPSSTLASSGKMTIRSNSAGLGVRRGQFSNLAKLSQKVEKSGVVTQRVSTTSSAGFEPMPTRAGATSRGSMRGSESRASESRASEPRTLAPNQTAPPASHSSSTPVPHR
jgi:uncharacterized protein DUF6600/FecR-like protein